ncbi:MAG: hypothetical protein HC880_05950 [Bacteroidia bacterium]|nr:hypothetical protein [Bacteroidia bacterium]
MHELLDPIRRSSQFPQLLQALQNYWEDEQRHRHEFWASHDEQVKAEFIDGEIIYHSPVYGRHWMASSNLVGYLIPHVRANQLGKVAIEKP